MNTLAERLSYLMAQTGTSITQLQDAAGVSYEMARRYTLGTATPRDNKVEKIAEYFQVSPSYLKYGEGETPEKNTALNLLPPAVRHDDDDNPDSIIIDVLDIEASAGFGAVNGDVVQVVKQLRFVPEEFRRYYPGMNPDVIRLINVKGDSMQPTFNHGDMLFVDISVPYFDGDGIYIFTFDNTLFVKRVQKTGREFCIISDNEAVYKPWYVKPEDVQDLVFHAKVKVHQSMKLTMLG